MPHGFPKPTMQRASARNSAIAKLDARAVGGALVPGEGCVIGFDGSRSDDAVVVVRLTDGRAYLVDTRPPLHTVAHAVDRAVRENA